MLGRKLITSPSIIDAVSKVVVEISACSTLSILSAYLPDVSTKAVAVVALSGSSPKVYRR
jgi:hypothetical protein